MRRRHLGTLSMVSLLVACGLPVSYETEHLRIGTDQEFPLCAGDLIAFESTIRRVEDDLGFSMQSKVSVSIWSDEGWNAVRKNYCPPDSWVYGCTSLAENAIYTSLPAIEHELVHAAISVPNLTPFFDEGLADVYSGHPTRFGDSAPADNLERSSLKVDRRTARHFVRWLRETWGTAKLGQLARLGKHAGERFEDVYGLSFADAQAMYFAEAPFAYPGLDSCSGEPLDFANELGGWRAVVDFDCATREDVRVYGIGLMVERTFVIPVAGHYSVKTDADGFLLSRCATGPVVEAVPYDEFLDEDVPPSYAGDFSEEAAFFFGGPVRDLYFEAGKHEIGVGLFDYDGRVANLAIWPSVGPRPVEGGD
jgi:hypothetical protein